jgi:hypothetical protein
MSRVAALLLAAMLCACSMIPESSTAPTAPPPPRPPSTADELVAYLARLRDLDETGLTLEATRQREFIKQQSGEVNRLKLALALSALQSEESEVLMLVEPLVK